MYGSYRVKLGDQLNIPGQWKCFLDMVKQLARKYDIELRVLQI